MIDSKLLDEDLADNCFVEHVLLPPQRPDDPPELPTPAKRVLSLHRQTHEVPLELIRMALLASADDSLRIVTAVAEQQLNSDKVRLAQRRICRSALERLGRIAEVSNDVAGTALAAMKGTVVEKRRTCEVPPQQGWRALPFYVEQLVGILAVVIGLCVEWANGITLLEMAGHLKEKPLAVRLAFVSPYILAAFLSIWLFWIIPGPKGRKRAGVVYLFTILPISLVGLYCFATKMGMDFDPDPFNVSRGVPMHWILFFGILAGAGIAGAGKIICGHASKSIWGIEYEHSSEYLFHAMRFTRWSFQRQEADSLASYLQQIIEETDAERQNLIERCLAELQSARDFVAEQSEFAARNARLSVLPVPKCLQYRTHATVPAHNGRAFNDAVTKSR